MDIWVLDTDFETVAIIDTFKSLIWTDRYSECGDFELYTSVSSELLSNVLQNYYIQNIDSDRLMIVEKILVGTDIETGNYVTISGRSLESILDRRIVWGQRTLTGSLQEAIHSLLNENIISPSDTNRKISNFVFKASTDTCITSLTIDAQYTGDNLYTVIQTLCSDNGIGFKITLNESKQLVFELYVGSDRSYNQTENPYVIFSPKFDNLINSNYFESNKALKNATLIGGEGEGSERRYASLGDVSGLNRREMFTDARDISSKTDDGTISDSAYMNLLRQRGSEKLSENIEVLSFEGKAETTRMFKYGQDFFMGDYVQVENEYGQGNSVRVSEMVISEDSDGVSVYPTFE